MPERPSAQTTPSQAEWDNEGGRLAAPPEPALPEGIVAIEATHYAVGPYRYGKLADAHAELVRQQSREAARSH